MKCTHCKMELHPLEVECDCGEPTPFANKKQTWTVRLSVANTFIADGFELNKEILEDMLLKHLGRAYPHEVKAEIVKAPVAENITYIQGRRGVEV